MDYQKRIDWTNSLKPGDRVAMRVRGICEMPAYYTYKVKRVQKTRIVMECGYICRRRRDGYPQDSIIPHTKEIDEANELSQLVSTFRHHVKWDEIEIGKLRKIKKILGIVFGSDL